LAWRWYSPWVYISLTKPMRSQIKNMQRNTSDINKTAQTKPPTKPICTISIYETSTRISKPKCNKNPPKKF
jgi:hypothetical protein